MSTSSTLRLIARYVIIGIIGGVAITFGSKLLALYETEHTSGSGFENISGQSPVKAYTVANNTALAYNMSGQFLTEVTPGTKVHVREIIKTASGSFSVCNVIYDDIEIHNVLINEDCLLPDTRSITSEELASKSPMERKTEVIQFSLTPGNPYASEYASVKKEYDALFDRAKRLSEQRDSSEGEKRMEYLDKLRMIKGEEIRLENNLKRISENYNKWNAEHGFSNDSAR